MSAKESIAADLESMASPGARPIRAPFPVRHLLAISLISAATCAAFFQALLADFVNWDDQKTVLGNQALRSLDWANMRWMFSHYLMGHYQPLALLSLAVDYRLWGLEPFGYHLTNIILHVLNASLFYLLAIKLLHLARARSLSQTSPASDSTTIERATVIGATAAALLFSLHPLRVESVAWITERRDVLSALFYLAATLAYLKAHSTHPPNTDRRAVLGKNETPSRRLWLLACVAFIMLSLLAKVIAATSVAVFLFLDWYPLGRLGGERGWCSPAARRAWFEKALFVLPALIFGVASVRAQSELWAWRGMETSDSLKSVFSGLFGLSFYLWKSVWPAGLCTCYEMPARAADIDLRWVVAGAVVLLAGIPLWICRRRQPALLVAWACYLVLIFPVLGVFQNWPQIAADRYSYLPCMGWAILAGAVVARGFGGATGAAGRIGLLALVTAAATGLGLATWHQSHFWMTSKALWERVLAVEPNNYLGHTGLGDALLGTGDYQGAAGEFKAALRLRPGDPKANLNLGSAYVQMDEYASAVPPLQEGLELAPDEAGGHAALGLALCQTGDLAGGLVHFREAIRLDPRNASFHSSIAWQLRHHGQPEQAIEQLQLAVRLIPSNAEYWYEFAGALQESNRYPEALNALRAGLEPCGRDPNLLDALARLLATCPDPACRDPDEGVRLAEEACKKGGSQVPSMLETLALAYEAAGRRSDALKTLESAIAAADQAGEKETAQRFRDRLAQLRINPS